MDRALRHLTKRGLSDFVAKLSNAGAPRPTSGRGEHGMDRALRYLNAAYLVGKLGLSQSFPTPVLRVRSSHAESTVWIALCAYSRKQRETKSFPMPVLADHATNRALR